MPDKELLHETRQILFNELGLNREQISQIVATTIPDVVTQKVDAAIASGALEKALMSSIDRIIRAKTYTQLENFILGAIEQKLREKIRAAIRISGEFKAECQLPDTGE